MAGARAKDDRGAQMSDMRRIFLPSASWPAFVRQRMGRGIRIAVFWDLFQEEDADHAPSWQSLDPAAAAVWRK
jgi:hypothetical protein